MYELFILGELMDNPMHGYLLREIISLAIGPLRKMSWGALYPLIRRLEEEGHIEIEAPTTERSENSERQRKVYRISESGRERFFYLMLKPDEYDADYPDRFNIKLINFDHLTLAQQREQWQRYQGYAQFLLDHWENSRRFVLRERHITSQERVWILQNIDHRLHLAAADKEWARQQLDDPPQQSAKNGESEKNEDLPK